MESRAVILAEGEVEVNFYAGVDDQLQGRALSPQLIPARTQAMLPP